jgi:hypothetical protein
MASVLLQSMRGHEVVVETRLRSATRDWRALIKGADFVLADVLSYPAVRLAAPRRVHEFRLIGAESIARVRASLGAGAVSPVLKAEAAAKAPPAVKARSRA